MKCGVVRPTDLHTRSPLYGRHSAGHVDRVTISNVHTGPLVG